MLQRHRSEAVKGSATLIVDINDQACNGGLSPASLRRRNGSLGGFGSLSRKGQTQDEYFDEQHRNAPASGHKYLVRAQGRCGRFEDGPRTLAPRRKDHSLPRVSYREDARSRSNKNDSWAGRCGAPRKEEAMIAALFGRLSEAGFVGDQL